MRDALLVLSGVVLTIITITVVNAIIIFTAVLRTLRKGGGK